ncbi:MAG: septal ring lytic transglycosylase RlpA family protein [Bacteroidales bacterium]|jgi:rare lipoprotein A|nr:septal ring lytic transglycosylase RlpA family protein [Bacteroidales bacterium]
MICLAWFIPMNAQKNQMEQKATYYHNRFEKRKTSTGEIFSQQKYTAAHKTLPLNSLVKITNKDNGRSVIVKINDRCPRNNVIDMSLNAAKRILVHKTGTSNVIVDMLDNNYLALWEKQDNIFQIFDRIEFEENYAVLDVDSTNNFEKTFLFIYYIKVLNIKDEISAKKLLNRFSQDLRTKCTIKKVNEQYFIYIGGFLSMEKAIDVAQGLKSNYLLYLEIKNNDNNGN